MEISTNKIIISKHVIFDETKFSSPNQTSRDPASYQFLTELEDTPPIFKEILTQKELASIIPAPLISVASPLPKTAPSRHTMTTRSKSGVVKHKQVLSLLVASPILTTIQKCLLDPNWNAALHKEYDAHIVNKTWSLAP